MLCQCTELDAFESYVTRPGSLYTICQLKLMQVLSKALMTGRFPGKVGISFEMWSYIQCVSHHLYQIENVALSSIQVAVLHVAYYNASRVLSLGLIRALPSPILKTTFERIFEIIFLNKIEIFPQSPKFIKRLVLFFEITRLAL